MKRALLGLLICACASGPIVVPSLSPRPTPTTTATASPTASPSPTARPLALDAHYAFLVARSDATGQAVKVRTETDPASLRMLAGDGHTVSPGGRDVAFWAPAGVRRELRLAPAAGGAERVLFTLGANERGDAIAWAPDSTGVAVQISANAISQGGVDPPPAYSAIRTIEIATGATKELLRRADTRLIPFGWLRDRKLVLAMTGSGLGRILAYLRIGEDGTVRESELPMDDCTRSIGLRVDPVGSTVLSPHPVFCSDGSGNLQGSATFRTWPVDDPAAARTVDLGKVSLIDARFRPRSAEVISTVTASGSLVVDAWNGSASRRLVSIDLRPTSGTLPCCTEPFFRPEGDQMFVTYPLTPEARVWRAKLVDLRSGTIADVDLGGERPDASAFLGP